MDSNGRTVEVKKDVLKSWIQTGKVEVVNLTLSQDGRLVDAAKPKEKVKSKRTKPKIEKVAQITKLKIP